MKTEEVMKIRCSCSGKVKENEALSDKTNKLENSWRTVCLVCDKCKTVFTMVWGWPDP